MEKTRQETTDEGGPIGFAPAYGTEDDKSIMSPRDAIFDPSSISVPDTTINCDDRNPCTRDYQGDEGCHHEAISCDDGDSSTIDTCGRSGCINTPAPALEENRLPQSMRQSILLDLQIINETNDVDVKSDVRCEDCNDGNACTTDSCDPATGCVYTPIVCDDSDVCTADTCDPATGCVFTPITCDDSDACTADSCDPATGCRHAAVDCNDNDACTSDSCDPITGCNNEPITCDDGNESTMDYCQSGECANQPIDSKENDDDRSGSDQITQKLNGSSLNNTTVLSEAIQSEHFDRRRCRSNMDCSDDNSSTNDYCYNGTCYHTVAVCYDGDKCTIDSFNGEECIYPPRRCSDMNPCTADSCDPATGECIHANNNAICDDRNACTTGDTCSGGSCKGAAVHCDDHNPCTYNRCDSKIGCYYPKKCQEGQICVDGTCKYPYYYYYPYYPYYPHYPYDVPYAPPAPTAPAPAPSKPQSYTIPAGTSITLP